MRFRPSTTLAISLLLAPSAISAAPDLVQTLPNKATVIARQLSTRPAVSIQAWVRAGRRDEPAGQRGIAGVLARSLLDRTARRDRGVILKEIAAMGGTAGYEVHYGYTVYSFNVPARYSGQAIDYLADALAHSYLEVATVNAAKEKERSEGAKQLEIAEHVMLGPMREALHPGTPLAAPFAPPEVEVQAITPAQVERFYRDLYVAENLTFVGAGDLDPTSFAQRVERALASVPTRKAPNRQKIGERSLQGPRPVVARMRAGIGASIVAIGFRAPEWGTADALALDVLMSLLVDGPASRARARLSTEGEGITSAAAFRDFGPDGGSIIYSLAGPADRMDEAEGILLSEIEKARSAPVSAEELEAAVRAVSDREVYPRSQHAGIAKATALAHFQGSDGADEAIFARLRAIRPEDLVAVARKYLDPKRAVLVAMAPERDMKQLGSAEDLGRRAREKLALYASAYRAGPPVTASSDADRRVRIDAPLLAARTASVDAGRGRVERFALDGGARLLVGEDHCAPLVTIGVYLAGGVRYEGDANNGVTALVKELLLSSVDPLGNGAAYRHTLGAMGNLTPYQDRDMWGYSITVPRETYPDVLRRLGAMLAHPEADTVAVDAARLFVLQQLDSWLEQEDAQRHRLIFSTRYEVSGYRLPGLGSHATVLKMPHGEVQGFIRRFVVRPNVVLAVFGDVQTAEVRTRAAEAFREVPDRAFEPGTIARDGALAADREKWELGGGPTTTVTLTFEGPKADSPDMAAFYVINSLFSGPKGWFSLYISPQTYVVSVTSSVAQAIDDSPLISTVTLNGAANEEEAAMLLFRQYKKVALLPLKGTIANELDYAKTHAIGSFAMSLDSNASRAFQYARCELFGLGMDYVTTLPARMDALSASDLTTVGLKYFQRSDFVRRPHAIAETRPGGW